MKRNGVKRTPVNHTDVVVAKPHCERHDHPQILLCTSCALPGIAEHTQHSNFVELLALPSSTKEPIGGGLNPVICCTSSKQWLQGCYRKDVYVHAFGKSTE